MRERTTAPARLARIAATSPAQAQRISASRPLRRRKTRTMPRARAASMPSRSVMTSDSSTRRSRPVRSPAPGPPGAGGGPAALLVRAALAEAADLEGVADDREALAPADPVLEPLDLRARELDDL